MLIEIKSTFLLKQMSYLIQKTIVTNFVQIKPTERL